MLIFLKLGGSLITDKTRPYTPRPEKLDDLSIQIAAAFQSDPELQLVLGHGSGSFGHQAASRFGTREGVSGREPWRGFSEVWYQASTLNRMVVESLHRVGLPAITLSPASSITANAGKVQNWFLHPLLAAMSHGLLPVIHGDVVFDDARGGTILSTEDLFAYLSLKLKPDRILLAGLESGIWADFPSRNELIQVLTPKDSEKLSTKLIKSANMDVTGGMRSKVNAMLGLVVKIPKLEVSIFSGEEPGNVQQALLGARLGTLIHR